MAYRLTVGGKITETTGGNYTVFAGKNIVTNANGPIIISSDVGHFYGEPKDAPQRKSYVEPLEAEGYFYTKEGIYLGNIGISKKANIIDESSFMEMKKGGNVAKERIIYFTEKTELNNEQFLNRANWVYGEGGGAFADRYAMTIKNLKRSGRSGYGPKPFDSDEGMYKMTMSHGNPPKTLYPDYLNGTYKGHNAQAFALAKKNLTDLNKNPKMNIAIKAVINSFMDDSKNEGYNNWRGSGDKLYSEDEKKQEGKKSGIINQQNLLRKDGKVYGQISTQKDHYWEQVGIKYRRHSFIKISYEKK
ncbi:hypothetical protein [Pseudomonas shirazensis]